METDASPLGRRDDDLNVRCQPAELKVGGRLAGQWFNIAAILTALSDVWHDQLSVRTG